MDCPVPRRRHRAQEHFSVERVSDAHRLAPISTIDFEQAGALEAFDRRPAGMVAKDASIGMKPQEGRESTSSNSGGRTEQTPTQPEMEEP